MEGPRFRFVAKDAQGSVFLDRFAAHDDEIMMLSVAAPTVQAKAIAALLGTNLTVNMELHDVPWWPQDDGTYKNRDWYRMKKPEGGFRVYRSTLDRWTGHVVAVAKNPRLLLSGDRNGILNRLLSSQFTTPILPEWVDAIAARMRADSKLADCLCYRCNAALMHVNTEHLDDIVADLVRKGTCMIPKEVADALSD